jgi:hypothetical protein
MEEGGQSDVQTVAINFINAENANRMVLVTVDHFYRKVIWKPVIDPERMTGKMQILEETQEI